MHNQTSESSNLLATELFRVGIAGHGGVFSWQVLDFFMRVLYLVHRPSHWCCCFLERSAYATPPAHSHCGARLSGYDLGSLGSGRAFCTADTRPWRVSATGPACRAWPGGPILTPSWSPRVWRGRGLARATGNASSYYVWV